MKKKNRVKQLKKDNKDGKHFLFSFLTVFFIFLVLILALSFIFYSTVLSNISSQNTLLASSSLDQLNNNVILLHFSENEQAGIVVILNGQERINLGEKYGEYDLQAVHQLLKLDKQSEQKIKAVFSDLLRLSINHVVSLDLKGLELVVDIDEKELNSVVLQNLKQARSLERVVELLKIKQQLRNVDFSSLSSIKDLGQQYVDLKIVNNLEYQNCSTVVVNGSSRVGVASDLAEVLEHTGVKVVGVEGREEKVEETRVYYQNDVCSLVFEKINDVFPMKVVVDSNNQDILNEFRASMVVVVGDDFL